METFVISCRVPDTMRCEGLPILANATQRVSSEITKKWKIKITFLKNVKAEARVPSRAL